MFNGDGWLETIFRIFFISMSASALYSLGNSAKVYDKLFEDSPVEPLDVSEQLRLDALLTSAKKSYNFSFLIAGLTLLLSSLNTFTTFQLPYGELQIPKEQTALGLFFLVTFFLAYTDRLFLMALPWIRLDKRRPPYDWVILGFSFEKDIRLGFWFSIPLLLTSVSTSLMLQDSVETWSFVFFQLAGMGFVLSPRVVYYLSYLIRQKLDHRGGVSTLSMNLLYRYRLIRQYLYFLFFFYPLTLIIPNWGKDSFIETLEYLTVFFAILYVLRMICGSKRIYRLIDKAGKKYGFVIESAHYK